MADMAFLMPPARKSGSLSSMTATPSSVRTSSQRSTSMIGIVDQTTRDRRRRKYIESLENDNAHEDPHADLSMSRKALNLFQGVPPSESGDPMTTNLDSTLDSSFDSKSARSASSTRKVSSNTPTGILSGSKLKGLKQRFRKNFHQLLEEELDSIKRKYTSFSSNSDFKNPSSSHKKSINNSKSKIPPNYLSIQAKLFRNQRILISSSGQNLKKPLSTPLDSCTVKEECVNRRFSCRFCGVCGCSSIEGPSRNIEAALYQCIRCGVRFCSVKCKEMHMETRCVKWCS